MAYQKPSTYPLWANKAPDKCVQPPAADMAAGWSPNQAPPAVWANWLQNSVGSWIAYLDQASSAQTLATSLDGGIRLTGGGAYAFSAATGVLSWSDAANIVVPSIATSANVLPAGSITLADGQLAYVTANLPLTTTASWVAGSSNLTDIAFNGGITVGMAAVGQGIPSGATVTAVSGSGVTLSADVTSTINSGSVTFNASGPLMVSAAAPAALVPSPNTVVLAVRVGQSVLVGLNTGQMVVRDGERRHLLETGYQGVGRLVAGAALTARQAVYVSPGASDARTAGNAYPTDAGGSSAARAAFLGFVPTAYASGDTAMVVSGGIMAGFTGLTPGVAYYLDPTVLGGITAAKPTQNGQFVVPVGMAVTPTALLINSAGGQLGMQNNADRNIAGNLSVAGTSTLTGATTAKAPVTAPSFVSAAGFKAVYYMGAFATNSWPGGTMQLTTVGYDVGAKTTTTAIRRIVMPFDGSMVAVNFRGFSSNGATLTLYMTVTPPTGPQVVTSFVFTAPNGAYVQTFGKGTYSIKANSLVQFSLDAPNLNIGVNAEVDMVLEMNA